MLDFGATSQHNNAIEYSDGDYGDSLDTLTSYTIFIGIHPALSEWAGGRTLISKRVGTDGWELRTTGDAMGNNFINMVHASGGAATGAGANTTILPDGSTTRVILWWDGTTFRYYINGTSEGDISFSKAMGDNAGVLSIGNLDGLGDGAQSAIGPVVIWKNYTLTAAEIAQADAGQVLPASSRAVFFHRGTVVPGIEQIQQIEGTEQGSVALLADDIDTYFPVSRTIENWRQLATQLLLERASDEIGYRMRVPLHLGEQIEFLDEINVSHDALMLANSRLANLVTSRQAFNVDPSQLFENWRRGLYFCVGKTVDWERRDVELDWAELEPSMSSYFASERAPFGTADDYPGVARRDLGGILTQDRTTKGYLLQENNQIAVDGDGILVAAVGINTSKVNHQGFLSEDAVANKVTDPVFANGLTDYTTTIGGTGTVTSVQNRLALPSEVTGNSIEVVSDASNEHTFDQVIAVVSSDGFMRVRFIHSDRQATHPPNWWVQRDTDSWYWDDANEQWASGNTPNSTPVAWDSTNSLEIALEFWSKPIPVDQNENWTLRVGKSGASSSHNFYLVTLTPGKLRYSPLVDKNTTVADTFTDDLDTSADPAVRQLCYAGRGTVTVDIEALQDGGDLEDGDQLAIWAAQFGSTERDAYVLVYQKLAGENVRFSFERWEDVVGTATLDVRATFDVVIVEGTAYRVTCRYVNDTTTDLGLATGTMRISVDDVNGVDAVASGIFSTSEAVTKLWFGYGPGGTGMPTWKRAGNYISLIRFQPRVITDEELLSA